MPLTQRTVYFVSDGTAITAETLGNSLISQFDDVHFNQITLPFVDTPEKAADVVQRIDAEAERTGNTPIIFSSLINADIRRAIMASRGRCFDLFEGTIEPLEQLLGTKASRLVGRYHGLQNTNSYDVRIDAVNYSLANDDGITTKHYDKADVILVGASRSGKTPTCLYLGMQFGIYAANYPLTEEDLFDRAEQLPQAIYPFRHRLYGLSIDPERLHHVRQERRPDSRYSSLSQCQKEIAAVEAIFISQNIPYINITTMSVEEIAVTVLHEAKLERRSF